MKFRLISILVLSLIAIFMVGQSVQHLVLDPVGVHGIRGAVWYQWVVVKSVEDER